ncbi:hypothetical protein DR095_01030 [Mycoplasma flocculare]|uniref:hypothetical protein n=1 Tax=Mesomycoplasma flocculare TaxID=2128 RepID=UPI00136FF9FF|nr:hypothetical protein [Mesomycoplasma flocculare]MXR55978.1 hypothetical protein [Mesomycoplasma flocculare]
MKSENKKNLLKFLKNIIVAMFAIRSVKLAVEITFITLIVVSGITVPGIKDLDEKIPLKFTTSQITCLIIWILLSIINWILYVTYFIKLNFLEKSISFSEYAAVKVKMSSIRTIAIIGFFISYVDIASMIMLLSFMSRERDKLVGESQLSV